MNVSSLLRPPATRSPSSSILLIEGLPASQVFVVRKAQHGKPEVYHLDASSPTALAVAEGFELKAKDVVFVDAAPVVRWSRVVNLLVPAAEASYFSKSASNP